MRRLGAIALLVLAASVGAGCGGGSDEPGFFQQSLEESERRDDSEAAVVALGRREVKQVANDPKEWIVYAHCANSQHCSAELRFEGLPTAPVAVERFRVDAGRAYRESASRFALALAVDKEQGCTDLYLETENPEDLVNCLLDGIEVRLEQEPTS